MRILSHMTKPVTLSDSAFAALRKEKKEGESDSDVVLRLIKEAVGRRKDPWHFVRTAKYRKRIIPAEEHQRLIRQWRKDDNRDAWAEGRRRNAVGGKRPAGP